MTNLQFCCSAVMFFRVKCYLFWNCSYRGILSKRWLLRMRNTRSSKTWIKKPPISETWTCKTRISKPRINRGRTGITRNKRVKSDARFFLIHARKVHLLHFEKGIFPFIDNFNIFFSGFWGKKDVLEDVYLN